MTKLSIARPFGELNLSDEFRLDPMHIAAGQVGIRRKGTGGNQQRLQSLAEHLQRARIETGSDLSGIFEHAVFKVSDQNRPEHNAAALRIAEAADDEFLAVLALELEPELASSADIWRIGVLGDDALPAVAACLLKGTAR